MTKRDLRDDGVYDVTCSEEHRQIAVVQGPRFEVLFDVAVNAVVDGYYREAVLSFNGSLERFLEYYVEVIALKNNISIEVYQAYRKLTAKQSERELGAFLVAYMLENDRLFTYVGDNKLLARNGKQTFTEFRNSVVHKGYIPDENEAVMFGNAMLDFAQPILDQLKERYPEYITALQFRHLEPRTEIARALKRKLPDARLTSTSFPSEFSPSLAPGVPHDDVASAVARRKGMRQRFA